MIAKKFTIYDLSTGEIKRVVECDPDFADEQALEGEGIIRGALDGSKLRVDPVTMNVLPVTKTDEDLLVDIRMLRDAKLSACDWTQLPDATVDKDAWAAYRQQLRDLPATINPRDFQWPTPPS